MDGSELTCGRSPPAVSRVGPLRPCDPRVARHAGGAIQQPGQAVRTALCRVGNVKLFFHALPHVPFLARQELFAGDRDRARRPKTWGPLLATTASCGIIWPGCWAGGKHGVDDVSRRGSVLRGPAGQAPLPGFDTGRDDASAAAQSQEVWASHVRDALAARSAQALDIAEESLCAFPADPELLLLAALTALATALPERALVLLKRYSKRYGPGKPVILLTCLALAQQGHVTRAWTTLQDAGLHTGCAALSWFVGADAMGHWLHDQLHALRRTQGRPQGQARERPATPPRSDAGAPPARDRPVAPRPARLPGRAVARRDGGQVRHRVRHQPRRPVPQRPEAVLGAAARDRLDRCCAPQGPCRAAGGPEI